MISNANLKVLEQDGLLNNVRTHVMDVDQTSGYPSDGQAANVSKETTTREVLDIEGVDKVDYKLQNINLMFGKVNTVEYATTMLNFPKLTVLRDTIIEMQKEKEVA